MPVVLTVLRSITRGVAATTMWEDATVIPAIIEFKAVLGTFEDIPFRLGLMIIWGGSVQATARKPLRTKLPSDIRQPTADPFMMMRTVASTLPSSATCRENSHIPVILSPRQFKTSTGKPVLIAAARIEAPRLKMKMIR